MSAPGIAVAVGADGSLTYRDEAGDFRRRDEPPVAVADGWQGFTGQVWPGPTVFPDFTDSAVRTWWGEQFRFYTERGVAGFGTT